MTTKTWTSKELADIQAARLRSNCAGCAALAYTGMPVQCNYHRKHSPDALTIAQVAAQQAYFAAHATTEI